MRLLGNDIQVGVQSNLQGRSYQYKSLIMCLDMCEHPFRIK